MEFVSILGKNKFQEYEQEDRESRPNFFEDLNLDEIVSRMMDNRKDYDLKMYFYHLPINEEEIAYRIQVLGDLNHEELFHGFLRFSERMKITREALGNSKECNGVKKARWYFDAAISYCHGLRELLAVFTTKEVTSIGLGSLKEKLIEDLSQESFQQFYEDTLSLEKEINAMRFQISLIRDRLVVTKELEEGDYSERLEELFPGEREGKREYVESPFHDVLKLSALENKILELFEKENKDTFDSLHNYYKKYPNFASDLYLTLEKEVQFYLSFIQYKKKMIQLGYHFAAPKVESEENRFFVTDGYDLALAQKYSVSKQEVVPNDAYYNTDDRFMVITGPNQGGKTTYARSMGQIMYFSLMGLEAPCTSAILPMFYGILTHFSVEESLESGRGKLKEELVRLAPMMNHLGNQKFVIINELFTSAATYDAYIMGRKVMEHFMKDECKGIYVTHIQKLAKEELGIISMVATLDKEHNNRRTFKILRRKADGVGYANTIVEKYKLTYNDLVNRL